MVSHPFSSARLGREKGRKVSVDLGPQRDPPPHHRQLLRAQSGPIHGPQWPRAPTRCPLPRTAPLSPRFPGAVTPPNSSPSPTPSPHPPGDAARGAVGAAEAAGWRRGAAPLRSAPFRSAPAPHAPHRTAPPGLRRVSTFRGEQRDGGRLASLRSLFVIYFISIFGVGGLTSPGHPTPVPPSRRGPLACPLCCLRDGAVGTPLRWGRLGAVFGRGGQARVQACLVATGDQTCPASRAGRRTALWDTAPWHPHPNASPMGPLCPLSPLPHCLPGGI